MDAASDIFRKNWRLILLILGTIVTFWLLYVFRTILLPFICGLVLAYLLYPVICWLEKNLPSQGRWLSTRRASLIFLIFIVILVLVGLLAFYIITGVVSSFSILVRNAPQYFSEGLQTFQDWLRGFWQWLPPEMEQQVQGLVQDIGIAVGNALRNAFVKGLSYVPGTLSLVLGFVSLPIFLFYVLKDFEKLSNGFYSAFSPQMAAHVRGVASVIDRILGRWIRAQLVLSATVASLCFIGFAILGIKLAPALAVLQGIMELVPILGPWIGGAIGVVVTLALVPGKAIWVAVVYLVVQLLENILLVPRIHGAYMGIHPAIILVLLALGAYVAGLWGIILIVPLTATIVGIYKYLRQNIRTEEARQSAEQ